MSADFYSNCLIEAVKAKIKDPCHVKIYVCWPIYNEAPCPHVMWSDGKADYDFGTPDFLSLWKAWTIHKGYIRKRPLGYAQHYIDVRRRAYKRTHSRVKRFVKKYRGD